MHVVESLLGTNYTLLESLTKNLELDVVQKLAKPVAVDAFWKHMDALAGAPKERIEKYYSEKLASHRR